MAQLSLMRQTAVYSEEETAQRKYNFRLRRERKQMMEEESRMRDYNAQVFDILRAQELERIRIVRSHCQQIVQVLPLLARVRPYRQRIALCVLFILFLFLFFFKEEERARLRYEAEQEAARLAAPPVVTVLPPPLLAEALCFGVRSAAQLTASYLPPLLAFFFIQVLTEEQKTELARIAAAEAEAQRVSKCRALVTHSHFIACTPSCYPPPHPLRLIYLSCPPVAAIVRRHNRRCAIWTRKAAVEVAA